MANISNIAEDEYNNIELVHFISDYNNCRVRMFDFKGLDESEFLNDALLELHLNYWLMRQLSETDKNRSYLFNTCFYTKLIHINTAKDDKNLTPSKRRHERVKKWTKNVNIFEKDFIFIPINLRNHWSLAVICFPYLNGPVNIRTGTPVNIPDDLLNFIDPSISPVVNNTYNTDYPFVDEADGNTEDLRLFNLDYDSEEFESYEVAVDHMTFRYPLIKQPCILIFDSLYDGTGGADIVATLREYLHEEYRAKHNGAERSFSKEIMKGAAVKVPQQPNYTDCGLYVLHFFEKFFECPIVDYSCPILHLETWFPDDEVTVDAKKRKEILQIILGLMNEQGRELPPGVALPALSFMLDDAICID